MDNGTKVRTVLAILTSINAGLAVLDIAQFGNPTADLIYKIASVAANALLIAVNTYYNNQYTEEGCIGTGLTRQLKAHPDDLYESEQAPEEVIEND